jgi:hypothetical protein
LPGSFKGKPVVRFVLFLIPLISAAISHAYNDSLLTTNRGDLISLDTLRQKYYAAVNDKKEIKDLENYLTEFTENKSHLKAIGLAYEGGLEALKSKYSFWPHGKLKHFKASMKKLSESINIEPDNLEIRFLRFSILRYVPRILGHAAEREADAQKIIKLLLRKDYSKLNREIQEGIVEFLIESEKLTDHETELLIENFRYLSTK